MNHTRTLLNAHTLKVVGYLVNNKPQQFWPWSDRYQAQPSTVLHKYINDVYWPYMERYLNYWSDIALSILATGALCLVIIGATIKLGTIYGNLILLFIDVSIISTTTSLYLNGYAPTKSLLKLIIIFGWRSFLNHQYFFKRAYSCV